MPPPKKKKSKDLAEARTRLTSVLDFTVEEARCRGDSSDCKHVGACSVHKERLSPGVPTHW